MRTLRIPDEEIKSMIWGLSYAQRNAVDEKEKQELAEIIERLKQALED